MDSQRPTTVRQENTLIQAECGLLLQEIEQLVTMNIRVHAAQNIPTQYMVASIDKINQLYKTAVRACEEGKLAELHDLRYQLKHFEEPKEVVAYHDQNFAQMRSSFTANPTGNM